jgi:predicted thioesterase
MPENISAAKALSIHGVLWTGLEPARAALQEILAQEGGLVPGITGQRTIPVTEARTAKVMESGLLPVFATPLMIASMENAASGLAEPYLAPGFSTVGTEVRIKHLSATPVGLTVRARAELTEVDGRRLVFAVSAFDDAGKIGEGIHERFIVENEKFMAKTGAKKSALPGT